MFFDKRREVYEKLNDKKFTKNLNCNYEYVIPHYLMYSTLGRADLIFSNQVWTISCRSFHSELCIKNVIENEILYLKNSLFKINYII